MKQHEINAARIKAVIKRLGVLADEVVFVGGAVTGFLISDPAAAEVRPTKDVDVITDVASRLEYAAREDTLRKLGLHHNMDGATCSFHFHDADLGDILLDFMPTEEKVLQLRSQWYKPAFLNAISIELGGGIAARIITAPYFLATKLEAFADRGKDDFYGSSDMSDIVLILDGRPELFNEIRESEVSLLDFLQKSFRSLLGDYRFENCIEGHLRYDSASNDRANMVVDLIRKIIELRR